jgi:hypothetical protein
MAKQFPNKFPSRCHNCNGWVAEDEDWHRELQRPEGFGNGTNTVAEIVEGLHLDAFITSDWT